MGGIHKAQPLLAVSVQVGVGEEEDSAATEKSRESRRSSPMISMTTLNHVSPRFHFHSKKGRYGRP